MNIGNIKIFLSILKSTSNILSVTKQSKALLYMNNPYRWDGGKGENTTETDMMTLDGGVDTHHESGNAR